MRSRWKIEDASILSTAPVMAKTQNPFLRLVMEIIHKDSKMRHLIQEWIVDSLSSKTVILPHMT